jgi:hypothetical protein
MDSSVGGKSGAEQPSESKEPAVYIGVGTIVVILLIIIIVMLMRRRV